jgi:hypothetical protein
MGRTGSPQAQVALLQRVANSAGSALIYDDYATQQTISVWMLFRARLHYTLRQLGFVD